MQVFFALLIALFVGIAVGMSIGVIAVRSTPSIDALPWKPDAPHPYRSHSRGGAMVKYHKIGDASVYCFTCGKAMPAGTESQHERCR